MKRLLILGTLALAGCATVPGQSTSSGLLSPLVDSGVITQASRDKAKQVQASTQQYCQYVPTLGTAISLVSASIGSTVALVGKAVCDAVTTTPLADGGTRRVAVNGVVIRGRFVK